MSLGRGTTVSPVLVPRTSTISLVGVMPGDPDPPIRMDGTVSDILWGQVQLERMR